MRVLGILVSIATVLHVAVAQIDTQLAEAFAKVPPCAVRSLLLPRSDNILTPPQQKCSLATLKEAKCELLDVRNCLCPNEDLQLKLSVCVVETCKVEDQTGIYT